MATMSKDEQLAAVMNNIDNQDFSGQSEPQQNRTRAWQYYFGDADFQEATPGRSTLVSNDVADMVEAIMAQIMPAFAGDEPATFDPQGEGDEEQSQAEADAVSSILMDRNDGYVVLTEAIKDALLLRNGVIKAWVDEDVQVETQSIPGVAEVELELLLISDDPTVVVDLTSYDKKTQTATIRLTKTTQKFMVQSVDPANIIIDPNYDSVYLDEIPFIGERKFITRSSLVEDGYDKMKVKNLPAFTDDTQTDRVVKNVGRVNDPVIASTRDQDMIEVYEVYQRIDVDGDGVGELRRYIISNRVMLDDTDFQYIPYASGTAIIIPHRYTGLSIYDRQKPIQDAKTKALRQWVDNIENTNFPRAELVIGDVDPDGWTNQRPGGGVPVERIGSVNPIIVPDTGMSSQQLLSYLDKIRDDRSGASLSLMGADDQLLKGGISAQSADRQLSSREQMAENYARVLSETLMRSVFILIHTGLRLEWKQPITYLRSGTWQEVNPSEWQERTRVNVRVGLSPGQRAKTSQALMTVLQMQQGLIEGGQANILTDINRYHRATIDWGKSAGVDAIESYFMDPESEESQEGQQASAQNSQQQAQMQQQLMQAQQEVEQSKAQTDAMKVQVEAMNDRMELQFKYFDAVLKSEIEESKLIGGATDGLNETQESQASTSTN